MGKKMAQNSRKNGIWPIIWGPFFGVICFPCRAVGHFLFSDLFFFHFPLLTRKPRRYHTFDTTSHTYGSISCTLEVTLDMGLRLVCEHMGGVYTPSVSETGLFLWKCSHTLDCSTALQEQYYRNRKQSQHIQCAHVPSCYHPAS